MLHRWLYVAIAVLPARQVVGQPQLVGGRCRVVGTRVEISGKEGAEAPFSYDVYSYNLQDIVSQNLGEWEKVASDPLMSDVKVEAGYPFQIINGLDNNLEMSYFPTDWINIYHQQVPWVGTGCIFNKAIYYLAEVEDPPTQGDPLISLSVTNSRGTYPRESTGCYPPFTWGFSVGYSEGILYLASTGKEEYTDTIYTLDLNTLHWSGYRVPGFVATTGGCIAVGEGFLVHVLGQHNGSVVHKAQVIDTQTWQKVDIKPTNVSPYFVPIGALGSVLSLMWLASVVYWFRIRRINKAPEYLDCNELWSNPKLCFKDTMSLSSELGFDAPETFSDLEARLRSPRENTYQNLSKNQPR